MTPKDEQRLRELIDIHPALLQPEAIEMRRHLLDLRDDLTAARAELAEAREKAAADLDAHSKDLMDAAVKQVMKDNDDGFSAVLRASTVAYAAKFLRREAATS